MTEDTLIKAPEAEAKTDTALLFSIDRAALIKSLAKLQAVVEKRSTVPILANILFEVDRKTLSMTATDMELLITERLDASVSKGGTTTIPAHTLYDIVRKLSGDATISFTIEGENPHCIHLKSGASYFTLPCLPAKDFPRIDAGNMDHQFTLASAESQLLIEKTRFAMSTEETRYYMNGVYLHASTQGSDPQLKAVATDGHRLAMAAVSLPDGAKDMPGVIIPRKTIHELQRVLHETEAEMTWGISATKIMFQCGTTTMISKLIDGAFPQYGQVIPKDNHASMEVDRASLAEAVDRVATIATEKARGVELKLATNHLTLYTTGESTTGTDQLTVTYGSDPIEIAFNARYLLEALAVIDAEKAQFLFGDHQSPVIIKDPTQPTVLYLIMPMRV